MPTTRSILAAAALGAVAGAIIALWTTIAQAQGSAVPGMAGPVQPVPGQAGPAPSVPGQAGPVAPAPGQSGPAPGVKAPVRAPDQTPPPPAAGFPRCDAGACGEPVAADGGA